MPQVADPQPSPAGEPLPVRYYPRRVADRRARRALSPSQALHLAANPDRAELARLTAEHREFAAPPPARRGTLRAWFGRLLRR